MPSALTRCGEGEMSSIGEAAVDPVGGGDADPDGEVGGEGGADGADDFEGEAGAVGEQPPYSSVRVLESGERNSWAR